MAQPAADSNAEWASSAHHDWQDFGEAYAAAFADVEVDRRMTPTITQSAQGERATTSAGRRQRLPRLVVAPSG